VTTGVVAGYPPSDGLWATPQTTLAGLVAKHRRPEYDAPEALIEAIAVHDAGAVPVAFLTDLDTTAGSSGSPTLDAHGHLVGVVFDGNRESLAADWRYDPARTRTLCVDVRYLSWLLAHDPDAAWLHERLSGPPRTTRR
jgi:hypothetical protein